MLNERNTIWQLDSWQLHQITPQGTPYGTSKRPSKYEANPDKSVVLQYTIEGFVNFEFEGEVRTAPAGSAYIFPSNFEPRWNTKADPTYVCAWVRLFGAGLFEHWQLIRQNHGPVIKMERNGDVISAMERVVRLKESHAELSEESTAIHAFVMELYQHTVQGQLKSLQPVERAVQYIIRYPYHDISLKQIANKFNVSREHLSRVFQDQAGVAPATWLREQRYKRAKELLGSTQIPIKDVVAQCGFGSVDVLARLLQKNTGYSPSAYREAHYWRNM